MAAPRLFRMTSLTLKYLQPRSWSTRFIQTSKLLGSENGSFDESMLKYLVCPLSKKQLRYDKDKNELISEEMNVAYPIINGIPNLLPQDGRILNANSAESSDSKDT